MNTDVSDTALLLAAITSVADELHPGRTRRDTTLDSHLDRDLGFDSLGRVEMLARLEETFNVALPDRLAVDADTPADLLRAIRQVPRGAAETPTAPRPAAPPPLMTGLPNLAETWLDVVDWQADRRPDAVHIRLYADQGEGESLTFGALRDQARHLAGGLMKRGLAAGDAVALMLPTATEYFLGFVAILVAGAVPVPLYPPFRPSHAEDHIRRQATILASTQARLLVTTSELKPVAGLLVGRVATLRAIASPQELAGGALAVSPRTSGTDTALLQYTSGSTGAPKGVTLSHANLLANVRAIGAALAIRPDDVVVSWLPLYHDMGLIGCWLGSLYHGLPLIVMPPLAFVARPARWLTAIHRHRGTLTAAPNFAFELCLRRIGEGDVTRLDLASLRAVMNGAEAISPDTMLRFIERFRAVGFRPDAMMPVYGLAESSVGLAFPPLGRGPLVDRVERQALTTAGRAVPAADATPAMRFVCCGRPLPGHQIRISDLQDRELPERRVGHIQFRGPSATGGYVRNAAATAALFHDEWLESGDLGYMAGGELYVTGRAKDIIIKAGRNFYPEEIEEAVGSIAGIRKGAVAAFGMVDTRDGTERLVVVAETRQTEPQHRAALDEAVATAVIDLLGMPPDRIVLAPPNTVLKTSSGKIRRAACRKLVEGGAIGRAGRPPWLQLALLRLETGRLTLGRGWDAGRAGAFAAYAWTLTALTVLVGWPAMVLLPRIGWRWRVGRALLRALAVASGTPLAAHGLSGIPRRPVVFVANHASYLDGLVLAALLPSPLSFVAKAELAANPLTGLPLRRLGTGFVERLDHARGLTDMQALAPSVEQGCSLVFFPEGTFTRMPGLLPFHMGAFMLAGQLGLACVPVAIRGTRSILRSGSWFPRPGAITVTVGPRLEPGAAPTADAWERACWLRDETRQFLLRHVGEPDLAYEKAER